MQPTKTSEEYEILYGQTVSIFVDNDLSYPKIGIVNGKIKDADVYVVDLCEFDFKDINDRVPNRHLPLEWGHYSGKEAEIIVIKSEIDLFK